ASAGGATPEPLPAASDAETAPAVPAPAPAPPAQPVAPEPAAPEPVAAAAMHPAPAGGNGAGEYHLTPAVRMLVREHDVDLAEVAGSGIGGRITKKDALEYVQRRDAGQLAAARAEAPAARPPAAASVTPAPASPAPTAQP